MRTSITETPTKVLMLCHHEENLPYIMGNYGRGKSRIIPMNFHKGNKIHKTQDIRWNIMFHDNRETFTSDSRGIYYLESWR